MKRCYGIFIIRILIFMFIMILLEGKVRHKAVVVNNLHESKGHAVNVSLKSKETNLTLDRDFIPAWRKMKSSKSYVFTANQSLAQEQNKNEKGKIKIVKKDLIYNNKRPNLLKSPLRVQNGIIHKAVTKFLKSLAGKRSIFSRPRKKNYHVLKKHLIPLTTDNDVLLSKTDISTTRYPFAKSEPSELTILKHTALDDIVNKAVDQVVAQIQIRKHKLHQLKTNGSYGSDPTMKRTSMNTTRDVLTASSKSNEDHQRKNDLRLISDAVEDEINKKLENTSSRLHRSNASVKYDVKNHTVEAFIRFLNTTQNTTLKTYNNSSKEKIHHNDLNIKNISRPSEERKDAPEKDNVTKEAFLDPFENVDSENISQLENDITKSAIEKTASNETLPVVEGEERMGYEIKDYYAAPNEEDTDSRDKIARTKSKAHLKKPKKLLRNVNNKPKINDVVKAFYNGGFNFLDGKGNFAENEDSFRTKESEDETRILSNGEDDDVLENEAFKNIKSKKIENASESEKRQNLRKCNKGFISSVSISKTKHNSEKLLQHKDYIESVNEDPPSFDEINIDEKNLHLEAKIDSKESKDKIVKDLMDVIKILRNLQPIHGDNDAEYGIENPDDNDETDARLQKVYPEHVLDLQSDKPSPSSYTVTLNGNVYRLEKLNKGSSAQSSEDIASNNSTVPMKLVLNVKTNEPNSSYDFQRIENSVAAKVKPKETESPNVLLDSSESIEPSNSSALISTNDNENKLQLNDIDTASEPDLGIENIENQSSNNRTVFIIHNKHHKTFKIEEVKDGDSPLDICKEEKEQKQDVFEIRHNNKIFRVIELNENFKDCDNKDSGKGKLLPCTPVHDDLKHSIPRDNNNDETKMFAGRTIHVAYKYPTENLESVREEVVKEISKETSDANDVIKVLPIALLANSSVFSNDSSDLSQRNVSEGQRNIVFKDDDLTRGNESDQLNKMSSIKSEAYAESSGLFRDRIEKSGEDNYDTFIFQIPRSKETKTMLDKTNDAENIGIDHSSVKKSNYFPKHKIKNQNMRDIDDLQETLNEQIVP